MVPLEENLSWDKKCAMKGGKGVLKVEQRSMATRPEIWVRSGKEGKRRQEGKRSELGSFQNNFSESFGASLWQETVCRDHLQR